MKDEMFAKNTKITFAVLILIAVAMIAAGALTGSTAAVLGILAFALVVGGYFAALLSEDFARWRDN